MDAMTAAAWTGAMVGRAAKPPRLADVLTRDPPPTKPMAPEEIARRLRVYKRSATK